jgi:hypothetical protein
MAWATQRDGITQRRRTGTGVPVPMHYANHQAKEKFAPLIIINAQ